MFEKILVAVDDSEPSQRALAVAQEMAERLGSQVEVLHVDLLYLAPSVGVGMYTAPVPVDARTDEAGSMVDRAVARLQAAGVTATGSVTSGTDPVGQQVADTAAAHDADLIVMGSRGRSQLAGLVLGSTAYQVIHLAACPVLVTRHLAA
ncbi:MAG TPA: universal stress protein [Candidatus Dormibacteraeota bacterium]|nr:universal stress protein [Candidatus Dormibacteraeota bacterium]